MSKEKQELVDLFYGEANENSQQRKRYLQSLRLAAARELNSQQKQAIAYYYLKGMNMRQTAERMGVHTSSVSRMLNRATGILKKTVWYYFYQ